MIISYASLLVFVALTGLSPLSWQAVRPIPFWERGPMFSVEFPSQRFLRASVPSNEFLSITRVVLCHSKAVAGMGSRSRILYHPALVRAFCPFDFTLAIAKLKGMVRMSQRLANAFIRNARARMQELGISQVELSRRMKVGQSFVSQMLSGHRHPGLESLDSFAKALEMEAADLLREKKLSKSA